MVKQQTGSRYRGVLPVGFQVDDSDMLPVTGKSILAIGHQNNGNEAMVLWEKNETVDSQSHMM